MQCAVVGCHQKINPGQILPVIISDSCLLFLILCLTPTCVRRVQSQVDEVIDVMQENISKVIERGERLDDLQDKSGESQWDTLCSVCVLLIYSVK